MSVPEENLGSIPVPENVASPELAGDGPSAPEPESEIVDPEPPIEPEEAAPAEEPAPEPAPEIDEIQLLRDQINASNMRHQALANQNAKLTAQNEKYRAWAGARGAWEEQQRKLQQNADAMDEMGERRQPTAPPAIPSDLGPNPQDDIRAEMREMKFERIRMEAGDKLASTYAVLQDPGNAKLLVERFNELKDTRLAGITDEGVYAAEVDSLLLDSLAAVKSKFKAVAARQASDLAEKKSLATPAQASASRPPQERRPSDPRSLTNKEIFREFMKEGRPGFTREEYRKRYPDG